LTLYDERQRTKWALRLSTELLRLLDLFERHAIPALPFKGPVLSDALYGDIAMRQSCDLDVLLRPQDLVAAKRALLAADYTTDLPTDAAREAAYLRARYELHFTTPDGAVPIEIHQAFLPHSYSLPFDYDALWLRLERRSFCNRTILALPSADLLLMLCAHGAKHAWSEQSGISDIARLLVVYQNRIPWPTVLARARAMGGSRILMLGLYLAANLFQAPIPSEILAIANADRKVVQLSTKIGDRDGLRFFLRTRERFRDKIACCTRLAFMPTEQDYSALPLPPILFHALRVAAKASLPSFATLIV
jgi:hypothetical protein